MGGTLQNTLQLVVQTEERLDPAEAEILQRKIALAERTGSKTETAEDLRARLRCVQDPLHSTASTTASNRVEGHTLKDLCFKQGFPPVNTTR